MSYFSNIINTGQTIKLGDKVRVSDPCYKIDTWCAGTIENVLPGKYHCFYTRYIESEDNRVATIFVVHKNYLHDINGFYFDEDMPFTVGVDSGQAGIYDLEYFIKSKADEYEKETWYERVCNSTYMHIKNPKYVPFDKSEFCNKTEYKYINYIFEENLPTDNISAPEIIDYYHAWSKYHKDICSVKEIGELTASTLDGKCFVSSSGYGDGSYVCSVSRNDDGQVVGIKIDYFPYDEEE